MSLVPPPGSAAETEIEPSPALPGSAVAVKVIGWPGSGLSGEWPTQIRGVERAS